MTDAEVQALLNAVDALARKMFKRVMTGAPRSFDDTISSERVIYHIHEFPTAGGEALDAVAELFGHEIGNGRDVIIWRHPPKWYGDGVDFETDAPIPARLRLRFACVAEATLKRKHQINFRREDRANADA